MGELAERMADEVGRRSADGRHLDLREVFGGLAVDCAAHCVYGADARPYDRDRPTEFAHVAKEMKWGYY